MYWHVLVQMKTTSSLCMHCPSGLLGTFWSLRSAWSQKDAYEHAALPANLPAAVLHEVCSHAFHYRSSIYQNCTNQGSCPQAGR